MAGGPACVQQCYTCEYYDGSKLIEMAHHVKADDYAKCENRSSNRHGDTIHYSTTCDQWVRWRKIQS